MKISKLLSMPSPKNYNGSKSRFKIAQIGVYQTVNTLLK